MKKHLPVLAAAGLFLAMSIFSGEAAAGARQSLDVCIRSLAPSLLPFFILADLLSALGLPDLLGQLFGGAMGRLFRVSPAGAQVFFLGLSGGYPLGASVAAGLRRDGRISRQEAEKLLAFCNNSGPGFIIGAAGSVLHSPAAGLLLYGAHALAAVTVGIILRGTGPAPGGERRPAGKKSVPFGTALTAAVAQAVNATATVCAFVVLFGALLGLVRPLLVLPPLAQALAVGFLELGGGVAALAGLSPTPGVLAAAALIIGWGGLSVYCQTVGVLAGTDIKSARHLLGRALCGVIAAVYAFLGALVLL